MYVPLAKHSGAPLIAGPMAPPWWFKIRKHFRPRIADPKCLFLCWSLGRKCFGFLGHPWRSQWPGHWGSEIPKNSSPRLADASFVFLCWNLGRKCFGRLDHPWRGHWRGYGMCTIPKHFRPRKADELSKAFGALGDPQSLTLIHIYHYLRVL